MVPRKPKYILRPKRSLITQQLFWSLTTPFPHPSDRYLMQLHSRAVTRYRNDLSCRQPKQLWQTMNPIANYGTRSATDLKPAQPCSPSHPWNSLPPPDPPNATALLHCRPLALKLKPACPTPALMYVLSKPASLVSVPIVMLQGK